MSYYNTSPSPADDNVRILTSFEVDGRTFVEVENFDIASESSQLKFHRWKLRHDRDPVPRSQSFLCDGYDLIHADNPIDLLV